MGSRRYTYARSCAGYCIAMWTLGLDTKNIRAQNIRIHADGSLFYHNFARFAFKLRRSDDAPFVFNNYMKYPLEANDNLYSQFVTIVFESYCVLRSNYKLLCGYFLLMNSSHQRPQDVLFLREALLPNINSDEEIAKY